MESSNMNIAQAEKPQNTPKSLSREYGQSYFDRRPFNLGTLHNVLKKWRDKDVLDRKDRELGFPEGFAAMSSEEQKTAHVGFNILHVKKLKELLLRCLEFETTISPQNIASSFGRFLRSHGGLAGILQKEIVELSEGVAMFSMASAWASRNNTPINLEGQLNENHAKLIVRSVYENKYLFHKKDARVGRLRNHCRRGKTEDRCALLDVLIKNNWYFSRTNQCCDEKYKLLKKICLYHLKKEDLSKGIFLEINKELIHVLSWEEAETESKLEMEKMKVRSSKNNSVNLPSTSTCLSNYNHSATNTENPSEERIEKNRTPSPVLSGPRKRPSESTSYDDLQRKKLQMNVPSSNLDAESNKSKVSEAVLPDCSTDFQINAETLRSTTPDSIIILDDDSRSSLVENASRTVEPLANDVGSGSFSNLLDCPTPIVKEEILEDDERESISSKMTFRIPIEVDHVINNIYFESNSKFLENRKYSDVIFIIGEEKFPAHRVIISGVSDKFTEMFDSTRDRPIELYNIEPVVFKELLRFIYTREFRHTIDHKLLLKLREVVMKYLNDNLVNEFVGPWGNLIIQILKIENAADILTFADRMEIYNLKEICMKFVKQNFEEVSVTEGYKELLNSRPELITEFIKEHLLKKKLN